MLNMTWLLRRIDGQWFTLSVSLNDDSSSPNSLEVAGLMLSAGALLAMHRGKRKR